MDRRNRREHGTAQRACQACVVPLLLDRDRFPAFDYDLSHLPPPRATRQLVVAARHGGGHASSLNPASLSFHVRQAQLLRNWQAVVTQSLDVKQDGCSGFPLPRRIPSARSQHSPAGPEHTRSSCPPRVRSPPRSASGLPLQISLLQYAVERAGRQVVRRLTRDRPTAGFVGCLNAMTAALRNLLPSVAFERSDDLGEPPPPPTPPASPRYRSAPAPAPPAPSSPASAHRGTAGRRRGARPRWSPR